MSIVILLTSLYQDLTLSGVKLRNDLLVKFNMLYCNTLANNIIVRVQRCNMLAINIIESISHTTVGIILQIQMSNSVLLQSRHRAISHWFRVRVRFLLLAENDKLWDPTAC